MPLPGDVSSFTLTFGPYTDARGAVTLVGVTGKLFAVDPSTNRRINLIDIASGAVVIPSDVVITIANDGTASVAGIPNTGLAALSPVGYALRVEWDTGYKKPSPGNLTFVVPAGSGASVDFDLLVPAATVPAVAIAQPTVATVQGRTGAVVLSAADVSADAAGAAGAAYTAAVAAAASDATAKAGNAQAAAQTFATNAVATQATADRAAYATPQSAAGVAAGMALVFGA